MRVGRVVRRDRDARPVSPVLERAVSGRPLCVRRRLLAPAPGLNPRALRLPRHQRVPGCRRRPVPRCGRGDAGGGAWSAASADRHLLTTHVPLGTPMRQIVQLILAFLRDRVGRCCEAVLQSGCVGWRQRLPLSTPRPLPRNPPSGRMLKVMASLLVEEVPGNPVLRCALAAPPSTPLPFSASRAASPAGVALSCAGESCSRQRWLALSRPSHARTQRAHAWPRGAPPPSASSPAAAPQPRRRCRWRGLRDCARQRGEKKKRDEGRTALPGH